MLGDYLTGLNQATRYTLPTEWAPILGRLSAPLGVHAILGNHDWWEDAEAQRTGKGPTMVSHAFTENGIPVL